MSGALQGKVAIVTGASANLGKLFAEALAADGAKVVIHYNSASKRDAAAKVAQGINASGGKSITHQSDLTQVGEVKQLVDATLEHFGQWDILVTTAGMVDREPIAEFSETELDRLFQINAKIPFLLMRQASKRMADHGQILNMITTAIVFPASTYGGYAGSKNPVEHFTKLLTKEIGKRGITVNCVAPVSSKGSFLYSARTDETSAWLKSMSIDGNIGEPIDILPMVRFLASPLAKRARTQTLFASRVLVATVN